MIDPPNREVALFTQALKLPAEKRAAYLEAACADDAALRQLVGAVLVAHDEAGAFLEDPSAGAQRPPTRPVGTKAEGAEGPDGTLGHPNNPAIQQSNNPVLQHPNAPPLHPPGNPT